MPSKPIISRLFFFPSSNFVTIASTCSLDSISAHLLKHLVYIKCPLSVLNYQYYLSVELFSSAYQHGLVSLIFRIEKKSQRLIFLSQQYFLLPCDIDKLLSIVCCFKITQDKHIPCFLACLAALTFPVLGGLAGSCLHSTGLAHQKNTKYLWFIMITLVSDRS